MRSIKTKTGFFSLFYCIWMVMILSGCGSSSDGTQTAPPSNNLLPPVASRSGLDNIWKVDPADPQLQLASLVNFDPNDLLPIRLLAVENPATSKAEAFYCNDGTNIVELKKDGSTYSLTAPQLANSGLKLKAKTAPNTFELLIPNLVTGYIGIDLIPSLSNQLFKLQITGANNTSLVPTNTKLMCGQTSKPSPASQQIRLLGAMDSSIGSLRLFYPKGLTRSIDLSQLTQGSLTFTASELIQPFGVNTLSAKQGSVTITQCTTTQIRILVEATTAQNIHINGEWLWQHQGNITCPSLNITSNSTQLRQPVSTTESTFPPLTPIALTTQQESNAWDLSEWTAENIKGISPFTPIRLLVADELTTPVIACFNDHHQLLNSSNTDLSSSESGIIWQPDLGSIFAYQPSSSASSLTIRDAQSNSSQAWCTEKKPNLIRLHTFWQQNPLTVTVEGNGEQIGESLQITLESDTLKILFGIDKWQVPLGSINNANSPIDFARLHLQLPDQSWLIIND